ncbi:MAG: iron-sulfur cluster assembly accessory protein [Thiohalomonadales bacterium]|jgi:iron-sulfur cluster assembly protein|nr:iron-sulfur cluster assembly accessory protein [Thiohalomonadales bacterium]
MFNVTPAAAEQIRTSAKQGQMEGMPLRVAAMLDNDGSLQYAMGFADAESDEDLSCDSEGIKIVIAPASYELLKGTTLDYVELEPGQFNFIFMNPNDPNYVPPNEQEGGSEHHF